MSLNVNLKADIAYSVDNSKKLITGAMIICFPETTGMYSNTIAGELNRLGIKNKVVESNVFAYPENIYQAIEYINLVNKFVERTNVIQRKNISYYNADLKNLDLKFGVFDNIQISTRLTKDGLNRDLLINTNGYNLKVLENRQVNTEFFDQGFSTNGIDDNGFLTIDLGRNPLITLGMLEGVLGKLYRCDNEATKNFAHCTSVVLNFSVREYFEREAEDMKRLSGKVFAAEVLGPVSDMELGKVKQ